MCRSAVKFPSSLVKRLRRIDVETRLKGYKYFEIERDFFNKLINRDFKCGVLLLAFVRFFGGDTGYLFLFVSLAVIQPIYIEMVFCKESMSVPFFSFPWILASPENGQRIIYFDYSIYQCLSVNLSILQKTINKTSKSPHAFAMCSIRTDLLKQENEKVDSL